MVVMRAEEPASLSAERPDVVNRLDAVVEAIKSLNNILASEESLQNVLQRVASNAVLAVADADAVSITVLGEAGWHTVASTDEHVLALDAEQYQANRGPCLEAAQNRLPVRVAMATPDPRWPEFMAASRQRGVYATLSIPLVIASLEGDDELVGSVNAYTRQSTVFDVVDEKLLSLYTGAASEAVVHARRWGRMRETVSQLEEALTSRAQIDQAKGALRVLNGCTADEAFAILVARSQHANIKLRDVARQIVDDLSRHIPASGR
jgi:transcriptional regulator with GAF, ATPase, and Fis domain